MKITKRHLRKVIREALIRERIREDMTPEYVYDSLMGRQEFGPNQGLTRMEMALGALDQGDMKRAANVVMDALWIDDPPVGADEELEDLLAAATNEDELAGIAADWGTRHFRQPWGAPSAPRGD